MIGDPTRPHTSSGAAPDPSPAEPVTGEPSADEPTADEPMTAEPLPVADDAPGVGLTRPLDEAGEDGSRGL